MTASLGEILIIFIYETMNGLVGKARRQWWAEIRSVRSRHMAE
jgi:hypothetical protein